MDEQEEAPEPSEIEDNLGVDGLDVDGAVLTFKEVEVDERGSFLPGTAEIKSILWGWFLIKWSNAGWAVRRAPGIIFMDVKKSHKSVSVILKRYYYWVSDRRRLEQQDLAMARIAAGGAGKAEHIEMLNRRRAISQVARVVASLLLFLIIKSIGLWKVGDLPPGVKWPTVAGITVMVLAFLGRRARGEEEEEGNWAKTTRRNAPPITSDTIVDALSVLPIPKLTAAITKDPDNAQRTIGFPHPIVRKGKGWLAFVKLPRGMRAGEVCAHREALASGLDRPLDAVWPAAVGGESPSLLQLYVCDKPFGTDTAVAWPYVDQLPTMSVYDAVVFGVDQQGDPVSIRLAEGHGANPLLVGGVPGSGKTVLLMDLLAIGGCDPWCKVGVINCKGGPDLKAAKRFAHWYFSNGKVESITPAVVKMLEELTAEMESRYAELDRLADDPTSGVETSVDRETFEKFKEKFYPILIMMDEFQKLTQDHKFGKKIGRLLEDLVRRGRAVGIIIVLATQKASEKDLPTGLRDNILMRIGFKVHTQAANDMLLGTGAHRRGVSTVDFDLRAKGLCYYIGGEGAEAKIVRACYLSKADMNRIGERGRKIRVKVGRLSGFAAEGWIEPDTLVLEDMHRIWPPNEPQLLSRTGASRLGELNPDRYGAWDGRRLSEELSEYGITTKTMRVGTERARGYERSDFDLAYQQHVTDAAGGELTVPEEWLIADAADGEEDDTE
jgi:S-DNA-T family DNA segregation ATPase FtsK/SpoIIIE